MNGSLHWHGPIVSLYGMKHILLMMTLMVLVGCGEKAEPLPAPHSAKDKPKTARAVKAEAQTTPEPSPNPDPDPDPAPAEEKLIADPIVEKAVRKELKKPEGELTEADFEKVTVTTLEIQFSLVIPFKHLNLETLN